MKIGIGKEMLTKVKKISQKIFFFQITNCRLIITLKSNYQLNANQRFNQINIYLKMLIYKYSKKNNLSYSIISSEIQSINR